MAMSRKHYREVASIISDRVENIERTFLGEENRRTALHELNAIASELAVMFKQDNQNFDRSQFMDACGF